MYGTGINRTGELLDAAVKLDIIHKSGAWFSYNGDRLGQGRDNVRIYMDNHPEFTSEIDRQVRENSAKLMLVKPEKKKTDAGSSVIIDDDTPLDFVIADPDGETAPEPKKRRSSIDIDADD